MKNMLKTIGAGIAAGAGTVIGFGIGTMVWDTVTDPVKRAAVKRKVVSVKNAIFKKEEGQ